MNSPDKNAAPHADRESGHKPDDAPEHDPLAPEPDNGAAPDQPDAAQSPNAAYDRGLESALREQITELEEKLATARDQTLRALADGENTRKRAQKDREDSRKYAIADFARDLLDFSDNFRRALESIPAELAESDERIKSMVEGIAAMEREMLAAFERHGIRKIEPLGELFNPNFHEVMFEAPGSGQAPGTIMQVMNAGYVLHDRLLRPARVGVAKDDGGHNSAGPADRAGGQVDTEV